MGSVPVRLVALVVALAGCRRDTPTVTNWNAENGYQWRALDVISNGRPGFTKLSSRKTGITFSNDIPDSTLIQNPLAVMCAGVALGDVNGDGRVDIFLASGAGPNALYLNLGGLRFRDIAEEAGVAAPDRCTTGAIFADADGDRDLDLFLNSLGDSDELYRNDGTGKFTPAADYPGSSLKLGSTTATLADVDGDGDLDEYVATHKGYTVFTRYREEFRSRPQIATEGPDGQPVIVPQWQGEYRAVRTTAGPRVEERGDPDLFFRNDGQGRFVRESIAQNVRFRDGHGETLPDELPHFGLAARFYDVNGDGAPDLYVANDFQHPDQLWINDGTGRFRHVGDQNVIHVSQATMSVDFGDINRDGSPDFFEVDMLSRDTRRLRRQQLPSQLASPGTSVLTLGDVGVQRQYSRNSLFLNRGDGTFAQISELAGIDASGWSWGALFLDVDLDGYEDLLVATGHRWDEIDGAANSKLTRDTMTGPTKYEDLPPLPVPNYAFRNRGDLTFEEVGDLWGFSDGPDISNGIAVGDLDQDGDLDVVVNRLNQRALILRNNAPAPRISVRLKGAVNTAGVGAKVRVLGGPVAIAEREVTAGGLYISHSDYSLTFGTGSASALAIEVDWRSGKRSVIRDAAPNREYLIDEAGAIAVDRPSPVRSPTWFADASTALEHLHESPPFPGQLIRQPLLPSSLAELGPGVTIADLDRDGDDDVVIAAGAGDEAAWYRNDGRSFTPVKLGLVPRGDLTTIVPLPRSGSLGLLAGQSSYASLDEAGTMPAVLSIALPNGKSGRPGPDPGVGPLPVSIGSLTLADFDRDGDLDLFVGGRVVPGEYPTPPASYLYTNRGDGTFEIDRANSTLFATAGMVSGSVATDIDGDGDEDLALAIDWGPIRLYLNDQGRFKEADRSWGVSSHSSRSLGIASGDFDGDGRMDLVSTSLGRNLRNAPDSARPLQLFYGLFDQDATLDLVLSQFDSALGGLAAITSYHHLRQALPSMDERVDGIATFAQISVDSILGPAFKKAGVVQATSLDNVVWLNRGDHFERQILPSEAQFAPAFAPVVADFDGDGREDIFLSQNFSGIYRGSPLNDGRGILLRGTGNGSFEAVTGTRSGIAIYGDQRGAASGDFDRDGRADLVVTQNNDSTRLFLNRTARPGLRVRLIGPAANPDAIGSSLRLRCGNRVGPRREIQAGAGYWSMNSPSPVLARFSTASCALEVRWPNGRSTTHEVGPNQAEITIQSP